MGPLSDEELISQWRDQAGSIDADRCLNELFQRHHERVAVWCLRLTGDRESAADLAQEVFMRAFVLSHPFAEMQSFLPGYTQSPGIIVTTNSKLARFRQKASNR